MMRLHRAARLASLGILVLSGLSGLGRMARADLPNPRLKLVFPPGGQAGTSVDVRVSGTGLEGLSALRCDEPGITSIPRGDQRFTVNIPREVPPGLYDLRAVGTNGMSSPRSFFVSPRETLLETEPNGTPGRPQQVR